METNDQRVCDADLAIIIAESRAPITTYENAVITMLAHDLRDLRAAKAGQMTVQVVKAEEILREGDLRDFGSGIMIPTESAGEPCGLPDTYFRIVPEPNPIDGKAE